MLGEFNTVEEVRDELGQLIRQQCNINGCDFCPYKWDKDSDGNSCRSDYLMMKEAEFEMEDMK